MNEHKAKAFLTNFYTKIFHLIGDGETAEYASNLLGKRRESFTTFQPKPAEDMAEEIFGTGAGSCSISESYQPVLQAAAFMSGLRSGGPPDFMVDGIVIQGGTWQRVSFSQR